MAGVDLQRAVGAEKTVIKLAGKTLRSLRKKAFVSRTARSSRKDVIEWIAYAVNLGGIAESFSLSSQFCGTKGFYFLKI